MTLLSGEMLSYTDGAELRFPVTLGDRGGAWNCKTIIQPGRGRRIITSTIGGSCRSSLDVAISFVAINAPRLRSWLTGGEMDSHSPGLYDWYPDIRLTFGDHDFMKKGPSGSACASVSLAVVLGHKQLVSCRQAITGTIDLRGRISSIGGVMGKVKTARDHNREMLIVPSSNLKELEESRYDGWPEERLCDVWQTSATRCLQLHGAVGVHCGR